MRLLPRPARESGDGSPNRPARTGPTHDRRAREPGATPDRGRPCGPRIAGDYFCAVPRDGPALTYSALVGAINHPDALNPYRGLFNCRSIRSLVDAGVSLDVVSPRPCAPPAGPYSAYRSLPTTADWGSHAVHHPRFWYLLPKRLCYAISGNSYAKRVPRYVESTFDPPDVVHACHIYPDGYGLLPYAAAHDRPLFVVSHGKLLNSLGDLPPGVEPKVRETLDAAAGVFCVSDALAGTARGLTDPAKVETVPIGADPERYPVDRRDSLRRELDIDPDAVIVLFVGQFIERKGVTELIDLLPELDLPNAEFVFVGHGGDLEPELRRAIAESGYSGRHVYTGVTSLALRRWFAVADLLLLPSRAEGRPTVIYEAMASETAVLASAVGGVPEQVADGETGRLLPLGDVDALRDALASLAGRPDAIRRMGEAGRRRLREHGWTWSDHAARVRDRHLAAIE